MLKKYLTICLFASLYMCFLNTVFAGNKSNLNIPSQQTTNNKQQSYYFGGSVSGSIPTINFPINSEPPKISGYRIAIQAYHSLFHWASADLFLDASFANWDASQSNISILAIAPILRYQYFSSAFINPFIDLSVGPAYLTKTMFVHNNLGIHYSFQDMIGLGFKLGKNHNLAISWRITHYSNAGLSKHNRGITVPVILSIDYHL